MKLTVFPMQTIRPDVCGQRFRQESIERSIFLMALRTGKYTQFGSKSWDEHPLSNRILPKTNDPRASVNLLGMIGTESKTMA
jgi:hypothetical protein